MSVKLTQKIDQRYRPLSRRRSRTTLEHRRYNGFELNGAVIRSQTSLDLRTRKTVSRDSSLLQRQRKTSGIGRVGDDRNRRKRRRRRKIIYVDTSRARTASEVVRLAIQQLGPQWREIPRGQKNGCQIYWNGVSFHESAIPISSGKINKFPGMLEILRKIKFSQIIHKMQLLFPGEYDFYPKTWLLPTELSQFLKEAKTMKKRQTKSYYIVKPDNSSQGDGIYLIRNPNDMMKSVALKPVVVQEYIANPLLIDNKKFDLRIYVVLKSIEPLEFYLCREGMARLCTEDYNAPSEKNLHHVFMHLTNYSLNKRSSTFIQSDDVTEGSKRTLTSVLNYLEENKYDVAKFRRDLEDVVCKTMLAIIPELKVRCHYELPRNPRKLGPSCFQILGLDVLLTSNLKPYLLEVNASPSLSLASERLISPGVYESIPSPVDHEIKIPLVRDTLALMSPKHRKTSLSIPSAASSDDYTDDDDDDDEGTDAFSHLSLEVQVDEGGGTIVPESCLEELFPLKYGRRLRFKNMRVFERIASIYIHFLGYHGNRMGQTSFRKFTRTCKLCINGFSSAAVDIMYIDISRRWNNMPPTDLAGGLCFNGFVEAFTGIAERKFASVDSQLDRVLALVDLCESYLALY
ncbi:tubulin polyglutamylase TTLL11-like [Glandiceps talaboti]